MLLRHPLAKPVSMIPPTPQTDLTRLRNQHNKWTKTHTNRQTHASILYIRIPCHSLQTKSICLCKIYTDNIYVSIIEKLCSNCLMWASNHGIQPSMANYELLFTSKFEDLYDTNSTKHPWLLVS